MFLNLNRFREDYENEWPIVLSGFFLWLFGVVVILLIASIPVLLIWIGYHFLHKWW